ncbi:MAG: nucleotidyltransferase, partial [Bacilli bacterium]|nr:nucleotidyltransferase [Bacilli bacterium]
MDHTQYLVSLGKEYIQLNNVDNLLCAFAGGSVGRGDADSYSDLDLNLYFSEGTVEPYSQNVKFKDKIIQLHIDNLPSIEQVYSEPWDFRFLAEARAIYDPQCLLQQLLSKTKEYLVTQKARQLMFLQAKKIVSSRIQWLNRTIESNECITAGIAVNAAWTDAAFLYAYFIHYSLCTGQLLPIIRNLSFYPEYRNIRYYNPKIETKLLLNA